MVFNSGGSRWRLLRDLLKGHAAVSAAKWGAGHTVGQFILKVGAQRAAVGVVAAGATGLHVQSQLSDVAREQPLSDGETLAQGHELDWLNAALKPVWDHLNAGIYRVIRDELEPALQKRIPIVGRYMYFKRLTLGEVSPRLGPVTVTRLSSEGSDGVEFNVGFEFAGDLAVEFSAGLATVELVDLRITGNVQVALRPLADALNPVGGVTISCLDRPSIDLKIRTTLTELVPNLYDFVREAVDDVVAGFLVVPNGIAVPVETFGATTDVVSLRYPLPKGLLRLHLRDVKSAQGQRALAKVYVQAQVGAAVWCSPMAASVAPAAARSPYAGALDASDSAGLVASSSPDDILEVVASWGSGGSVGSAESGQGCVQDFLIFSENQSLELRLFEKDAFGVDRLAGRARVLARDVVGEADLLNVELLDCGGGTAFSSALPVGRSIGIHGDWLAVSPDPPSQLPAPPGRPTGIPGSKLPLPAWAGRPATKTTTGGPASTAGPGDAEVLLTVRVDEARGLPEDADCLYFVRATVGKRMEKTRAGFPPPLPEDTVSDEVLVAFSRRLSKRVAPKELSEAMGLPEDSLRELVQHDCKAAQAQGTIGSSKRVQAASRAAMADVAWDSDWCQRARARARALAASRCPQFGQAFHMPAVGATTVSLELVRQRVGGTAEAVVARLEKDLAELAACGGRLEGPFELMNLSDAHVVIGAAQESAAAASAHPTAQSSASYGGSKVVEHANSPEAVGSGSRSVDRTFPEGTSGGTCSLFVSMELRRLELYHRASSEDD